MLVKFYQLANLRIKPWLEALAIFCGINTPTNFKLWLRVGRRCPGAQHHKVFLPFKCNITRTSRTRIIVTHSNTGSAELCVFITYAFNIILNRKSLYLIFINSCLTTGLQNSWKLINWFSWASMNQLPCIMEPSSPTLLHLAV